MRNFVRCLGFGIGICLVGCSSNNNGSSDAGVLDGAVTPLPDGGGNDVVTPQAEAGADSSPQSDGGSGDAGSPQSDGGSDVVSTPLDGAVDGGAEGGADAAPIVLGVVPVSGDQCTVAVPTQWKAAAYVINCDLRVTSSLRIDPGAVLKFANGRRMNVESTGTLVAEGTAAAPIVFTSVKDDAHGGDSNADGLATTAAGGDWKGVSIDASGSKFDHCAFYYGAATDDAALSVDNSAASVTVTNSMFAHNRTTTDAITAKPALDASEAAAGTIITGNTFFDNMVPLAINGSFSLDDSNVFDNSALAPTAPQPNKYNGVMVAGCGQVKSSITWSVTKVPLVLGSPINTCKYLTIVGNAHLTLGGDTVMKFFNGGYIDVDGILTATAPAGKRIVFTSIRDDAHGGDTNADGTATAAAGGDWQGISLSISGSTFDRTDFLFGAGNDRPALVVANADARVSVTNSTFAHNRPPTDAINAAPALDLEDAAATTVVTGNIFYDNTVPLVINTTFSLDDSNSFNNAVAAPSSPQPNKYNGVFVRGCGNVSTTIAWSPTKVPLVVGNPQNTCKYLTITGSGHLTLGDDVTMKFFADGYVDIDSTAILQPGARNFFTSIKDDAHGGDTNADGAATTPTSTDWKGMELGGVCHAPATVLFAPACQ